jgi:hypothetical protein
MPNSKIRQYMPYYIEVTESNSASSPPEGIKEVTDITSLTPAKEAASP